VVIAIIAILAAILFPVFARAKEKANQASCLSNMKQIILAVLMYASDHDEMVFGGYAYHMGQPGLDWFHQNCCTDPSLWDTTGALWRGHGRYDPYVRNDGVWWCPNADTSVIAYHDTSYGYNNCLQQMWGGGWLAYWPIAQIQHPAECVFWVETPMDPSHYYYNWWTCNPNNPWNVPGCCWATPEMRHNGGCNLGYLDGHAKWQSEGQLSHWGAMVNHDDILDIAGWSPAW